MEKLWERKSFSQQIRANGHHRASFDSCDFMRVELDSIFGFVTLLWPFMASCQITKTLILFFKGHLVQGRPESLFGPQSRGREARYARDAQVTRNYYNWLGELHLRGWKQSRNGARPHRIVRFVFFKIFSIFSYQEFMSHFCVAVGLQQFRGMLFPNKY